LLINPKNLLRCHDHSFGLPEARLPQKETHARWKALANAAYSKSAIDGTTLYNFTVDGIGPVCRNFWAAAYGVTPSSRNTILAEAEKGLLQAEKEWVEAGFCVPRNIDAYSPAKEDTIEWWSFWLETEDQMPNEATIVHRNVIWQSVYESEYKPDMDWWGTSKPLSKSRWTTYRNEGLIALSISFFGADEFGKPFVMLQLLARANHSNFGGCSRCHSSKLEWLDTRTSGKTYSLAELTELKKVIFRHALQMRAQRVAASRLFNEAAGSANMTGEMDDKLGSEFIHLPSPVGGREIGGDATRWKYRIGLQANLFPGGLLRMSIVPPMLKTGANFGNSALLSGIYEMSRQGTLGDVFIRLTDSGPDNDALVTHQVHASLIHYGVFQQVIWVRLEPKHSHNMSDRTFSMIKETVWPRSGALEGGCAAPWDLERVIKTALKTQKGSTQLAWHLANFDFVHFFEGCASDGAADMSEIRYIYMRLNTAHVITHMLL